MKQPEEAESSGREFLRHLTDDTATSLYFVNSDLEKEEHLGLELAEVCNDVWWAISSGVISICCRIFSWWEEFCFFIRCFASLAELEFRAWVKEAEYLHLESVCWLSSWRLLLCRDPALWYWRWLLQGSGLVLFSVGSSEAGKELALLTRPGTRKTSPIFRA